MMPTNVLHGQVFRKIKKLLQETRRGGFLYNFVSFLNKPGNTL